jgi:leucyl-tRNA synthetase
VCHKCGGQAERDTNTLDTFFDSSFYFLRYVDKTSKNEIISLDKFKKWLPVDIYIGGLEHAILHLLYSRFIYRFFLDFVGNLGKDEQNEKYFPAPFEEMITQGIIRGKTIKHKKSGKFLTKDEAEKYQQSELTVAFEKMSKSKMNGINPIQEIEKYGIDIVRLMILFSGPIQQDINYEEDLYKPIINFTKKFSKFFEYVANNDGDCDFNAIAVEFDDEEVRKYAKDIINLLIDSNLKITERSFHVAIARLMECLNILNDKKEFLLKKASNFLHLMSTNYLILLYPFAPHIASEEFSKLNKKGKQFVFTQKLDEKLGELKLLQIPLSDQVKVQVQVNGKFKGVVMVPSTETKNIELILNEASIQIKGFSVNKSEIHKYISPENNKILNLVTAHKKNKV